MIVFIISTLKTLLGLVCVITPFSAGPRNRIDQHLAVFELKIIISEFLERLNFKLKDGYQLKMISRLTYEPFDSLVLELSRKRIVN